MSVGGNILLKKNAKENFCCRCTFRFVIYMGLKICLVKFIANENRKFNKFSEIKSVRPNVFRVRVDCVSLN